MNGLDPAKASHGPDNEVPGSAPPHNPRRGPDGTTATVLRDAEPAPEPPVAGAPDAADAQPVPGKGDDATPPAKNPWHHSRPRRGAQRGPRRGAAAPPGGLKGLLPTFATGNLARHFGPIHLPHIRPPLGRSWLPWVTGALAVVWLGATSLHPVGAHEQAIVVTAGAWGPALGPGLVVSWPWPIGSATIDDVTSVRHLVMPDGDGEHLILTRDGALIDVAYDVRWRISDLRAHALTLADPDAMLRLSSETAIRATLAGMDFATVMGAGVAGTGRDTLGHDAARRLQVMLDRDRAGIAVTGIDIRRADPPAHIADALRAVIAARGDAATEAMQAHSWARQLVVTAQGEAGAFDAVYDQYRHAPDVTRRQMYYATMERVLAQSDKVIVDAPGTTMALPPLIQPTQVQPTQVQSPQVQSTGPQKTGNDKTGNDAGAANGH